MRSPILLSALFICLCCFVACTYKTECSDQYRRYYLTQFTSIATNDTVPDTSVTLIAYVKGSKFTTAKDTFVNVEMQNHVGPTTAIFMDRCISDCDDYDWKFIFFPSGKTFSIKDITHRQRTLRAKKGEWEICTNDITMLINDSLYLIHGEEGGRSATSYVDIKIRY